MASRKQRPIHDIGSPPRFHKDQDEPLSDSALASMAFMELAKRILDKLEISKRAKGTFSVAFEVEFDPDETKEESSG